MLCSSHMGRAGLGSPQRAGRAASLGRGFTPDQTQVRAEH